MTDQVSNGKPQTTTASKNVSIFPENKESSVQPLPAPVNSEVERETEVRERMRLKEEQKHHEETGS